MRRLLAIGLLLVAGSAHAEDGPYSYEDLSKIITALCQKASYGFRAEVEGACPQVLKRLEPQIAAEKKAVEKKDDKQ